MVAPLPGLVSTRPVPDLRPVRVLLVRHGETSSNVAGLLDTGSPGADLTERGREEAAGLVPRLAGETVETLLVSPLARARQTIAPLAAARGLTPVVDARLREISAGDLEMRGDAQAMRAYLGAAFAWVTGDLDARVPGGESGREACTRFDEALAAAVGGGSRNVVVVTHGAMIRSWCAIRAGVPFGVFAAHPVPNTGIVALEGGPGAWSVASWVDHRLDALLATDAARGVDLSTMTPDVAVHGLSRAARD